MTFCFGTQLMPTSICLGKIFPQQKIISICSAFYVFFVNSLSRLLEDMLPLSPVLSPLWLVTTFAYQMASNSLCSDFSEGSSKLDSFNMFDRLALLPSWSWWIISRRFRWRRGTWSASRRSFSSLSWPSASVCRQARVAQMSGSVNRQMVNQCNCNGRARITWYIIHWQ